jgi:hypothetical protein
MQLITFITKANTIARTLKLPELVRPELEKMAKGESFDYTKHIDAIIKNQCSVKSPLQPEDAEEQSKNEQYQMFPEAFVEQRQTLKVVKRGDNRTLAEYNEKKQHYIEYSDNDTDWTTFEHDTLTDDEIVVDGLENGVPYKFRVSAINKIGTTPSPS